MLGSNGQWLLTYYISSEVLFVLSFLVVFCRPDSWIGSGVVGGFFPEKWSSTAID